MVPTANVEMIVPTNANMQIAPKFLKKVLCKQVCKRLVSKLEARR
jgi:hypothetical protein